MHPNNFLVKVIAEVAKAATPPGSAANSIATSVKQAAVLLDGLTAQTPVQQAHALASMLGEGLSSGPSSKQMQSLATAGSAILLLLEALHYVGQTQQTTANQHSPMLQSQPSYQYPEPRGYSVFENEMMQLAARQEELQEKLREQAAQKQAEIQTLRRQLGLPDM